ncbi:hypothetical protein BI343_02245 [Chromobacterium amazonense]|nr:hypothetical protein BI343_02245 [Chromobacterium amazonense]
MRANFQLILDEFISNHLRDENSDIQISIGIGSSIVCDMIMDAIEVKSITTHSTYISVDSAKNDDGTVRIIIKPSYRQEQEDLLKCMIAPWRNFQPQPAKSKQQHIVLSGASGNNF